MGTMTMVKRTAAIIGLMALPAASFQPTCTGRLSNHAGRSGLALGSVEESDRRAFIGAGFWSAAGAAAGTTLLSSDFPAAAAEPGKSPTDNEDGQVSASEVARRLRQVPTFTIVDKRGVPFMVFGEDAKLTAYFFTEYGEASRILDLASKSSDKSINELSKEIRAKRKAAGEAQLSAKEVADEVGINPWKEARVSSVSLDFAVTMASRSGSQRGGAVYFKISPSEDDVSDALALDKSGKDELPEGKVPLFYFEDFELPSATVAVGNGGATGNEVPEKVSPLYFRKSELFSEWKKEYPDKELPEVKVSELLSVVTEMVKPGGKDEDLKSLVFIPPAESLKKAKDCDKKGGKEQSFMIGERIVVL